MTSRESVNADAQASDPVLCPHGEKSIWVCDRQQCIDARRFTDVRSISQSQRFALVSLIREARALNAQIDNVFAQAIGITGEKMGRLDSPLLTFDAVHNIGKDDPEITVDEILRGLKIEVKSE